MLNCNSAATIMFAEACGRSCWLHEFTTHEIHLDAKQSVLVSTTQFYWWNRHLFLIWVNAALERQKMSTTLKQQMLLLATPIIITWISTWDPGIKKPESHRRLSFQKATSYLHFSGLQGLNTIGTTRGSYCFNSVNRIQWIILLLLSSRRRFRILLRNSVTDAFNSFMPSFKSATSVWSTLIPSISFRSSTLPPRIALRLLTSFCSGVMASGGRPLLLISMLLST